MFTLQPLSHDGQAYIVGFISGQVDTEYHKLQKNYS